MYLLFLLKKIVLFVTSKGFFSRAPVLYEETGKDNEKNEPKNWQLDIKSLGSTF